MSEPELDALFQIRPPTVYDEFYGLDLFGSDDWPEVEFKPLHRGSEDDEPEGDHA